MPDTASIETVVHAARLGDESAFGQLVEEHYRMVHGLALSRTGDWDAAADVTQEAFLLAWANLGKLEHPRAFRAWLCRIARNVAATWGRNEVYRHKLSVALKARATESAAVGQDPAGFAARRECAARIGQALSGLSPKLREAVVIYYLEGHTLAEGAQALGIAEDTMRKRVKMGRERLRKHYAEEGESELDPLLPYSPRAQVDRVLAGLAFGPAVPALGKNVAPPAPVMVLHHLLHGGSLGMLKGTGLVTSTLKWGLCALCLVAAGSVTTYVAYRQSPEPNSAAVGNAASSEDYAGIGIVAFKQGGAPSEQGGVFVLRTLPGSPAEQAGLRLGDRIVAVDGHPVPAEGWPDFGSPGTAGEPVLLTIVRGQPGGVLESFDISLVKARISTKSLTLRR